MADLGEVRDRLAGALSVAGRCDHPGSDSCAPWHQADAVMPVVADLIAAAEARGRAQGWEEAIDTAQDRARYDAWARWYAADRVPEHHRGVLVAYLAHQAPSTPEATDA